MAGPHRLILAVWMLMSTMCHAARPRMHSSSNIIVSGTFQLVAERKQLLEAAGSSAQHHEKGWRARLGLPRWHGYTRALHVKQILSDADLWRTTVETIMMDAVNTTDYSVPWEQLAPVTPDGGTGTGGGVSGSPHQAVDPPDAPDLLKCWNQQYRVDADLLWHDAMVDKFGSLRAVAAWWPKRRSNAVNVTLVTAASISRLPQLYAQCHSWAGPLSVVLYQPLHQVPKQNTLQDHNLALLRQAVFQVSQFVSDMAHHASAASSPVCQPEVLLVYEVFREESARDLLYPSNTLRNIARLQARTPLIAQLDIDLLVSRSLYERMSDPGRAETVQQQATQGKTVFIVPALDVRSHLQWHERTAWADALVSTHKDVTVEAWKQRVVIQFASEGYPTAHNLTDFPRWLRSRADYSVAYQPESEPWLLSDRLSTPWHDERYRGYGLNKQQMVLSVNTTGFQFKVLHDIFTVHRAHKKSDQRFVLLERNIRQGVPDLFDHNKQLYQAQRLKGPEFVPSVSTALHHCLQVLPWWADRVRVAPRDTSQPVAVHDRD